MTSQKLGEILIEVFKDCTLQKIIACQENNSINNYIKEKVSPETFEKMEKADPVMWIDAIRTLYLSK